MFLGPPRPFLMYNPAEYFRNDLFIPERLSDKVLRSRVIDNLGTTTQFTDKRVNQQSAKSAR